MRLVARVSEEAPNNIMTRCLQSFPVESAHLLPQLSSIKRTLRNNRRTFHQQENEIEKTVTGDQFIRFTCTDYILIAADTDMDTLTRHPHWLADGTFNVAPIEFQQLYTIHVQVGDKSTPCVYVLMRRRTEEVYRNVFERLRELRPDICPESIMVDFEQATLRAFNAIFPSARIPGCGFHLSQCVWLRSGTVTGTILHN